MTITVFSFLMFCFLYGFVLLGKLTMLRVICYYIYIFQVGFSDLNKIKEDIMQKTVDGLKEEGIPYIGKH